MMPRAAAQLGVGVRGHARPEPSAGFEPVSSRGREAVGDGGDGGMEDDGAEVEGG